MSLYLHHLNPDDLASMDGMVSRLIRPDAISDNGSKKRGSVEGTTANKRVSSGGFLENASEADLTRLFAAPPPSPADDPQARLNMFMTHYDRLEEDVRGDVSLMIAEEAAQLRHDLRAQHQRRRSNSPPGDGDEAEADESNWEVNEEPGIHTVEVEDGEDPGFGRLRRALAAELFAAGPAAASAAVETGPTERVLRVRVTTVSHLWL